MSHQEQLARAYLQVGIPLDRLPYSLDMDRLVAWLSSAEGEGATSQKVWRELVDLRKRGKLPKLGRL
jgi:hypothetical protein